MTKLKLRAFLYQLVCFVTLFIGTQFLVMKYTDLTGIWGYLTVFVVVTLISPMFQAVKTKDGEKLFMKWIFMKGVKQIG